MAKIDYRALIAEGKIQNLTDLLEVHRQEIIEAYETMPHWPAYEPTEDEMKGWIRIYSALDLVDIVPFQTYILIINEKQSI